MGGWRWCWYGEKKKEGWGGWVGVLVGLASEGFAVDKDGTPSLDGCTKSLDNGYVAPVAVLEARGELWQPFWQVNLGHTKPQSETAQKDQF